MNLNLFHRGCVPRCIDSSAYPPAPRFLKVRSNTFTSYKSLLSYTPHRRFHPGGLCLCVLCVPPTPTSFYLGTWGPFVLHFRFPLLPFVVSIFLSRASASGLQITTTTVTVYPYNHPCTCQHHPRSRHGDPDPCYSITGRIPCSPGVIVLTPIATFPQSC